MNMFRNIPFHPQWARKFRQKKPSRPKILVNIFNLLTLNKIFVENIQKNFFTFLAWPLCFFFWSAVSAKEKIPQFYTYQFFM